MKRTQALQWTAVVLGATALIAGCSFGSGPEVETRSDEDSELGPSSGELVVVTADGERWVGPAPRIRIIAPLPDGRPAVADVSLSVASPRGTLLGVHFELAPSTLADAGRWEVDLDSEKPTRPGFGVVSYGSVNAPRSARSGRLSAETDGKTLTGTFAAHTPEVPSLASAKFEGRYTVECYVPEEAMPEVPPAEGSVGSSAGPGAFALHRDVRLESEFCAQFRGL
jgi:hypothetical protein